MKKVNPNKKLTPSNRIGTTDEVPRTVIVSDIGNQYTKDEVRAALVEEFGTDIVDGKVTKEDKEWFDKQVEVVASSAEEKFDLDGALDSYDPKFPRYSISEEAINFFNLMRLVAEEDFEFSTPRAHYFMVDMLLGNITDPMSFPYSEEICKTIEIDVLRLSFLASRGLAKSTIAITFFGVYSAIMGRLPNKLGQVFFYLVVTASTKGGARVNAKAVQSMCIESAFLNDIFESMRFTETESEFVRRGTTKAKNRTFLIRYQGINTAIRGIRDNHGRRPDAIIADDTILNTAAAYSKTQQETLNEAIHSDAINALKGGGKARIIMTFTPFSYGDVNTRTVIEKSFTPIVLPIAKWFEPNGPTDKIESSWSAMHPAGSIKAQETQAKRSNTTDLFMQERMLRLTSSSNRLIPDSCFQYYDAKNILNNIWAYNIYITTDYTTTSGETSDFSGIAVWAVSNNGDQFLLDLVLKRMGMKEQYTKTLNLAAKYKRMGKHVEIGVEIDGNQAAHVYSLEEEMMKRGDYYTFARDKNNPSTTKKGITSRSSGVKKHERFRIAVSDTLLVGKMWFPRHLKKGDESFTEFVMQIKGATHIAFTKSDDGPDLISQLSLIDVTLPTAEANDNPSKSIQHNSSKMWGMEFDDDEEDNERGSEVF